MASADRLIEIFNEAKARPPGAERDHYLSEVCRDGPALKEQVQALLKAHEGAGDFLQHTQLTPPVNRLTEKPGDRIGRYKLLEQIGEGGCGVVYMAEQEEPVRRRVALKVIKLGMDTKNVIARFEAERQALAMMDHPNIAKVLDAGSTDTGRPFFVMELVRGIKITDYCDQNKLSTADRLGLFIQVCQAIQHAHQKGIIHRDIKPSNILVTISEPGAPPCPMVIDFGIAKATTGQALTDKTVFTAFEQFIGTPAYMSPEQAMMTSLDIDTRTDIYALGVLLYELLTGQTPFDAKELMAAGLDAMRRIIREQEPARPSTRLSTMLEADLTRVARRRQSEPARLGTLVRGDLDWIVMKALEKDRARRYDTANGFAMDIQRHLENQPVIARPPSAGYRFQKLVRRNQLAFAAGTAVAIALIFGLGLSTWLFLREREASSVADQNAHRAEQARQQAEANEKRAKSEAAKSQQVAQFLKDMLNGVGPSVALGRDTVLLREILDRTAERIGDDLASQPEVEVELRAILARIYEELGLFQQQEEMARKNLQLARSHLGDRHPAAVDALQQLAVALLQVAKLPEAEKCIREVLARQRQRLGNEHLEVARSLNILVHILRREQKRAEAETNQREALAMQRRFLASDHPDIAHSLYNLALVLASAGKLTEAEATHRETLAMQRRLVGEEHPQVAEVLGSLATVLRDEGKLPESESMTREGLAMKRKFLGDQHPEVASSLRDLAIVLRAEGRLEEAEALLRQALAMRRKLLGNEHLDVSAAFNTLASLLREQGKMAETDTLYREELTLRKNPLGGEHPKVVEVVRDFGIFLMAQEKMSEAEPLLREAMRSYEDSIRRNPQEIAPLEHLGHTRWHLGHLLNSANRPAEAEQVLLQALKLFENATRDFPSHIFFRQEQAFSHRLLGDLVNASGRLDETERHYRASIALYAALQAESPGHALYARELAYTTWSLARKQHRAGRKNAADGEYDKAIALYKKAIADFPAEEGLKSSLAELLRSRGNAPE